MCLTKAKLIQTKNDIVCYKVLKLVSPSTPNKFYSPIIGRDFHQIPYAYELNRTELQPFCIAPEIVGYRFIEKEYMGMKSKKGVISVANGAFHSFKYERSALKYAKRLSYDSFYGTELDGKICQYVVVKCIIPKDSRYIYKGQISGEHMRGYASSAITPIEIVKNENEVIKNEKRKNLFSIFTR